MTKAASRGTSSQKELIEKCIQNESIRPCIYKEIENVNEIEQFQCDRYILFMKILLLANLKYCNKVFEISF